MVQLKPVPADKPTQVIPMLHDISIDGVSPSQRKQFLQKDYDLDDQELMDELARQILLI